MGGAAQVGVDPDHAIGDPQHAAAVHVGDEHAPVGQEPQARRLAIDVGHDTVRAPSLRRTRAPTCQRGPSGNTIPST
jgi:hypothetical protein